jgi:hypothetical protein
MDVPFGWYILLIGSPVYRKLNQICLNILGNSWWCTYLMQWANLLAGCKEVSQVQFWKTVIMSCSVLNLLQYSVFCWCISWEWCFTQICRWKQKQLLQSYIVMCRSCSFRLAQKLIRGMFVYVSFKPVSVEMSIHIVFIYKCFLTMVLYYYFLNFGLLPSSPCF